MTRLVAIGIGIVVVAAAAVFGWMYLKKPETADDIRTAAPASESGAAAPGATRDETADARAIAKGDESRPFEVARVQVNTKKDEPEACLVFTRRLDMSGEVAYADYVRVTPKADFGIYAEDTLLCLTGLDYSATYQVTVRAGLPSESGAKLETAQTLPVELRDRPPAVHFGSGLILPREVASGIPVTTVNVDKLKVRIYRVGDRILARLNTYILQERSFSRWDRNNLADDEGSLVWEGEMDVNGARNATAETVFPFRKAVPDGKPGAYLVVAEDAEKDKDEEGYYRSAGQWVIDSDLGVTSFTGADGLHVFVRSLRTATPTAGVRLTLIARNNDILGEAKTDGQGAVRFDPGLIRGQGGLSPVAIMAYGAQGDFNFLDLRRAALDFSDRGVGGRSVPGPIDAFVYLDRGIYRPGETVHVTGMLRDRKANALSDSPLTLVIRRPDGIEFSRQTFTEQKAGAAHAAIELSRTAPRGYWQALVYVDPKGEAVGRQGFLVQDFVPERLAVEVQPRTEKFDIGKPVELDATARFLYGAPAAGLQGEAELTLTADPSPFPDYKDYQFGKATETVPARVVQLDMTQTDEAGKAVITGELRNMSHLTRPLRANVRVAVFEPGGRATRESLTVPVRAKPVVLGIRRAFDGSSVEEGAEAGFEVIALDADGKRIARDKLNFKLVRIAYHYQWFFRDNQWRYEWTSTESLVDEGGFDIAADAPARIARTLKNGSYRLEVADRQARTAADIGFNVGWWSDDRQGPDNVTVVADKPAYKAGQTAHLTLTPPVGGKALVVVARDRMFETRLIDLPKSGRTIDVKVSEDWGSGAYVLVTAYRPLAEGSPRAPVRAVGVSWLQIDQSSRTFEVSVEGPEKVVPQSTITVPVSVRRGGKAARSAYVTVAAVDEGILQLTDFATPSPDAYYFAKLRLALDMRDDYGRLIEASGAVVGDIRSGGDMEAAAAMKRATGGGLDVIPTRTVALFSGIVELDRNGKAEIPLEIPDFAGELRLMAVAFSDDALGHGDRPLTVRRDVVGELTLPRFLAPGDMAKANLSLHNVEGAAGPYTAEVKLSGAVAAEGETRFEVELGKGQRRDMAVGLTGKEVGIGQIRLLVRGPNGFKLDRDWSIQVRPAQPPVIRQTIAQLQPGETLTLNADTYGDKVTGTASVALTFSPTPAYDVPGLLRALDRYPFGCLEQVTSRAFPLLYFTDMSLLTGRDGGLEEERDIRHKINGAVSRLLDMQHSDGGFGMWSYQGTRAYDWLGVYALDFMVEAKSRGYFMPADPLNRGFKFLERIASNNYNHEVRAYAFYVLAKEGRANLGDLRYFHDTRADKIEDALTLGFMAAALDLSGDRARGGSAFARAVAKLEAADDNYQPVRYGSLTRDTSALLALAARAGRKELLPRLLQRAQAFDRSLRGTTTQDQMWMLMAAHALSEGAGRPDVEVNGKAQEAEGPVLTLTPTLQEVDAGYTVTNRGKAAVWYTLTVDGVPVERLPAVSQAVTITRNFFTMDGQLADLSNVRQNDRFVVVIEGDVSSGRWWGREMILLDLLPAGLEIEAPIRDTSQYSWIKPGPTYADFVSVQDDRYVASFRTRWTKKMEPDDYKQSYVVRAVTPGTYALPPSAVEDMYAPGVHARTDAARITVTPAGGGE